MSDSTRNKIPQKPYADFPLSPRRDGRWSKKIKGTVYTFKGSAEEALEEYKRVCDDLHAGRKPRPKTDGLTIFDLCTKFLDAKQLQLQSGEIQILTWNDYKKTCKRVIAFFGQGRVAADLVPEDFEGFRKEMSKTRKLVALGNEIRRTRVLFKYGYDAGLLSVPVKFGPMFKQPSAKALKRIRALKRIDGENKEFTADEIKKLLKYATPQMQAMILLGVNCGFGNNDCARLSFSAVDLESGWVSFPRPKTGALRRCPLWKETLKAIKEALSKRRKPKNPEHANLVFITAALGTFAKDTTDNPISKEFAKLADDCGLKRKGRGFYSLRHTFRTVAGGAKDLEATRLIMGHDENAIEDSYIENIGDDRLLDVAKHVHSWLFGKTSPKSQKSQTSTSKAVTSRKKQSTSTEESGERFQLRIVG
jgi:integrase